MDIDVKKLLRLVKARSPLYNYRDKDHANKVVIESLWLEVATEMKCQVSACKSRWRSLRNSYARHLRAEKIGPSNPSDKQRKRWYFAGAMAFLKDFINQHHLYSVDAEGENMDEISHTDSLDTLDECTQSSTSAPRNSFVPSKRCETSVSDMVADAMTEFLKSRTRNEPTTDANALFFKSLLADFEKLSSKRQRAFKVHIMHKMNEMQEEEENDHANIMNKMNGMQEAKENDATIFFKVERNEID